MGVRGTHMRCVDGGDRWGSTTKPTRINEDIESKSQARVNGGKLLRGHIRASGEFWLNWPNKTPAENRPE